MLVEIRTDLFKDKVIKFHNGLNVVLGDDRATNSILNGGVNPRGISPTIVPLKKIEEIIKKGLSQSLIKNNG